MNMTFMPEGMENLPADDGKDRICHDREDTDDNQSYKQC